MQSKQVFIFISMIKTTNEIYNNLKLEFNYLKDIFAPLVCLIILNFIIYLLPKIIYNVKCLYDKYYKAELYYQNKFYLHF